MTEGIHVRQKAVGEARYAGDVELPGMVHAAIVRSDHPHALIVGIATDDAMSMPGVIGVYTAEDMSSTPYGRRVRDHPILAKAKVRHIGEPVAAVVAATRREAELASRMVRVEYEPQPAVFDPRAAVSGDAPLVHDAPWTYHGAAVTSADPPNVQSVTEHGDEAEVDAMLASAAFTVDRTYSTAAGHAGYIEPQACVAHVDGDGVVHVWSTNKAPYRLRDELVHCLDLPETSVVVHPVAIGGDFGGKGSYGEVPLCAELARLTGRPVRIALRYWEDLIATHPRHSTVIRVRLGCDEHGHFAGLHVNALVDGGAYADGKARAPVDIHGIEMAGSSYRIPAFLARSTIAYTNSVPRGHVRAPGSPQAVFAVESAIDELAGVMGMDPVELRVRNLLRSGEPNPQGTVWTEARGTETLHAAVGAPPSSVSRPGRLRGRGVAIYDRGTNRGIETSLRLTEVDDGSFILEIPQPETGAGSHTVVRDAVVAALGIEPGAIRVEHIATSGLPYDRGVGASRVTVSLSLAVAHLAARWRERGDVRTVEITVKPREVPWLTSFCAQVADVAVDPETGEIEVLELVTAVDVATIVNPAAHRMQIDGGAVMGWGFALIEDLRIEDGLVYASNLGEFDLPCVGDVPRLRTILVDGAVGVGALNVKPIGELSNVPTAAAIANAVAAATGIRIRRVPIRPEDVWEQLQQDRGASR